MLNCRLGTLPPKYLGIPISDRHLDIAAFEDIYNKMRKRLDPWEGQNLTSGGRLTLTNTCLSSLPMYIMGFYHIPGGGHDKMDSIRTNLFWKGAENNFKYHMARWELVCCPKDQGGLGIMNTRITNECLLVKWIWRITKELDEMWFRILQEKIHARGWFLPDQEPRRVTFLEGATQSETPVQVGGGRHRVKDGRSTSFWNDTCLNNTPLRLQYS